MTKPSPTPSQASEHRPYRAALKRWGLALDVNQAGPLLEQMAKQWAVTIDKGVTVNYVVGWRGAYGCGDSVLAAALDCVEEKTKEVSD